MDAKHEDDLAREGMKKLDALDKLIKEDEPVTMKAMLKKTLAILDAIHDTAIYPYPAEKEALFQKKRAELVKMIEEKDDD